MLPKGLGFCHTPGVPDICNIFLDLDAFKTRMRLHLFFLELNQDSKEEDTPAGITFEHKSFNLKSSFNPEGPFQIEVSFACIEHELHKLKYNPPTKKLPKEEFKAM